jgi:ribosome modulation factor
MNKQKQDYVAHLERAISQKYGSETIHNPQRLWDEGKEKEYIQQSQAEQKKFAKLAETQDKVEQDGFLINKKLLNREHNRTCPICEKYSFRSEDDLYMNKFEACFKCYIQYIEDREERWMNGWRPTREQ